MKEKRRANRLRGKVLNGVLACLLAVGLMPSFAFAAERPEVDLEMSVGGTGLFAQEDQSPVDISALSINKFDATYAYTGSAITIKPSFKDKDGNKLDLVEGKDYTMSYKQDGQEVEFKDLGTYQVTLAGIGGYTGAVSKDVRIVPYFTVYIQRGTAAPVAAKAYSAEEFAALKSDSSDPVSALFNAGATGWNVDSTSSYVTMTDLAADAGLAADWKSGATVSWEAKAGATTSYSYDELQGTMFYPNATTNAAADTEGAVAAPLVFALTECSVAIDTTKPETAPQTAAAAQEYNLANANAKQAPRVIVGVSEADYKAPSAEGAKTAGQRLWSYLNAVTISVPKAANPMTVTASNKAVVYKTAKQTVAPLTVKKAQGTVTYAKTSGKSYFTVNSKSGKVTVKAKTPAGAYTVKIKVTASGNEAYNAGSTTKSFKVTVKKETAKAAPTAKAYKVAQLKKKAQSFSIKPTTDGKVTYKVVKKDPKGKLSFSAETGKITVAKGTPKGTYMMKVKISAKAGKNYNALKAKTFTVKVAVK